MAFTLGQHPTVQEGSQVFSLAYASNVTAGNLLIAIAVQYVAAGTIFTPIANTGTAGAQTWHPLLTTPFQSATDGATTGMWYAIASGTGSCTVTLTWNGATGGEFYLSEWSGSSISAALVQDGAGQHSDGTLATINLPSLTTSVPDALIIGYVSSANAETVHSPWVVLDTLSGDNAFYQADVAAATYTPNITQTSGTYACVLAAVGIPGGATAPTFMPGRMPLGV